MLYRRVDFVQIALNRMAKHQLSKSTFDRIKAEFDDLTTRGRIEVAYKIERARELGDLKENGDYHAAKDEQGHMEGRIRQIESILEDVEVVTAPADGVVGLGSVVAIVFEGDSDSDAESYLIGHVEEKPENDSVSVMSPSSPLGSALLGAKEGDVVTYDATNAKLKVKVLSAKAQK
ncbi:MAG: transcription elongation factor GreA [Actinomycetota bacterium]|jgi:transcription elongation factor GreA